MNSTTPSSMASPQQRFFTQQFPVIVPPAAAGTSWKKPVKLMPVGFSGVAPGKYPGYANAEWGARPHVVAGGEVVPADLAPPLEGVKGARILE